jgi:hypothetical protein
MKLAIQTILFILLSTTFAFSQESTTFEKNGFSVTFSSDWETNELNGRMLYILGSDKNEGNFMTTVDIEMTPFSKTVTEFSKHHETDLKHNREYGNLKIKKTEALQIKDQKAMAYYSTATTAGIPIEIMSITLQHKGKIVVIKSIAHWFNEAAKTKDFVKLTTLMQTILDTIKM